MAKPTAITLLTEAKHVALLPVRADDMDAVASAAALAFALREAGIKTSIFLGKTPTSTSGTGTVGAPPTLTFLGGDFWHGNFSVSKELKLTIPRQTAEVSAIWYERTPSATIINVASNSGNLQPNTVKITERKSLPMDAIVTLGAPSLRSLGERFTNQADLFYRVPILNIAYTPETESFGTANHIDWNVRSNAELVYRLLMQWDPKLITPKVATALLAALLAKTESFQKIMTSPEQFELAATLFEKKADYHAIVKNLFKTKPLTHLQLWGSLLSNLQTKAQGRLAWTKIDSNVSVSRQAIYDLVDQVLIHTVEADVVLVFVAGSGKSSEVLIATPKQAIASKLIKAIADRNNGSVSSTEKGHMAVCRFTQPLESLQGVILQTCELFLKPGYTEVQTHGHFPQSKSSRPVPAN